MPYEAHTISEICNEHRRGLFDPRNREQVRRQLRAEGLKRIEAFPFERLFWRKLRDQYCSNRVTTGWSVHFDDTGSPDTWYRLLNDGEQPNAADATIARWVQALGRKVVYVTYEFGIRGFVGRTKSGTDWVEPLRTEVPSIFSALGCPVRGRPRDWTPLTEENFARFEEAVDSILANFTDFELTALSISRLWMNCDLASAYNKQPMDLDACYVSPEGHIKILEFKRKYPTQAGTFGLDQEPHKMLADWLLRTPGAQPLLHVILCGPVWSDKESPLPLLDTSKEQFQYSLWAGIEIKRESFTGRTFKTTGRKSGSRSGDRIQHELLMSDFKFVGKQDQVDLCGFIEDPVSLPSVSMSDFRSRRDLYSQLSRKKK